MELVWDIFCDYLYLVAKVYGLEIHAFVLMSNHYHLLASTPYANISDILNVFQTCVAKEVNRLSGVTNHLFGQRYRASVIYDPFYFANAYRYVYQNPVRAEIVERAEQYRFSTLHGLVGNSRLILDVQKPKSGIGDFIPDDIAAQVNWFNDIMDADDVKAMRCGFKRREFKVPKGNSNYPPNLYRKRFQFERFHS